MPYPKKFACHFVGVGAVIIHNNSVLVVKLTYVKEPKKWIIPGGMVDCGETLEEAVTREVAEETGLKIKPLGIIGIRSMVRESDGLTDIYIAFLGELQSDPYPLSPQESEIEEIRWLPLTELNNDDVSNYTRNLVKLARVGKTMQKDTFFSQEVQKNRYIKKYEQFWV